MATWLSLLAYLVCGAVPVRGLVLCFGADGHVAIETQAEGVACAGCDASTAATQAAGSAGDQKTDGACGCACTDIPLRRIEQLKDPERLRLADPGEQGTALPAVDATVADGPACHWHLRVPGPEPARGSPHLELLRTVILLV